MERSTMVRKMVEENIPVWEWKGLLLVRIGKEEFVTVEPVAKDIRTLEQAKKVAIDFSKKNKCNANVAYDIEWKKMIEFLKINYSTKTFLKKNNLGSDEVLLLDSISEGETHVLAAGAAHCLDEIFRGFISGDDADGEPQPRKLLFLTIKNVTK